MQYKTIVLSLIEQQARWHEQLRQRRNLLETVNQLAQALRANHLAWIADRTTATPDQASNQIASEALELAMAELLAALPPVSSSDEESLSLDAAMEYLKRHTPTA